MSAASPKPSVAGRVRCRVCGRDAAQAVGEVEYFSGYRWPVYDCGACGCRFTPHDSSVYDAFHRSGAISYYDDYRGLAEQARGHFAARAADRLRELLARTPKYRFVIGEVDALAHGARLLEVGCSRGYLTSYFILQGRPVLGIDVSDTAVRAAASAFGEHFALAASGEAERRAPYDLVYHAGMIGCVGDPLGLTRSLLALLKPGGRLVFNAPNRDACWMRGQLWLDSAPPPDVVTLFPAGFWHAQLGREARVAETVEMREADEALGLWLRRRFGPAWRAPIPGAMQPGANRGSDDARNAPSRGWQLFERAARKIAKVTRLSAAVPPSPAEFGLHVTIEKSGA